jgi:exoribonuclease R
LTFLPPSDNQPRLILNDPIIEVSGPRIYDDEARSTTFAQNIVEESMILACSTAAAWCAERNIPMMYRGSIETPMSVMAAEKFRERVVKPHMDKYGKLSRKVTEDYIETRGKAIIHTSPLEHKFLGVPSYTKVTSPLRRFSDMVGHWQIESAMRYEAESGRKFDFNTSPTGVLPFRHEQMQKAIVTFSVREAIIRQCQHRGDLHWVSLAFMRAHFYGEAKLPETLRMYVRRVDEDDALGVMTEYGFPVHLTAGKKQGVREGDEWEGRLDDVKVYAREIWLRPERLVHRDEEVV